MSPRIDTVAVVAARLVLPSVRDRTFDLRRLRDTIRPETNLEQASMMAVKLRNPLSHPVGASGKENGAQQSLRPINLLFFHSGSRLQTARVCLHIRQQVLSLLNQVLRCTVGNRCSVQFGTL